MSHKYILFHANTYYIIQLYIMSFNTKEQLHLSITEATDIIVGKIFSLQIKCQRYCRINQ